MTEEQVEAVGAEAVAWDRFLRAKTDGLAARRELEASRQAYFSVRAHRTNLITYSWEDDGHAVC